MPPSASPSPSFSRSSPASPASPTAPSTPLPWSTSPQSSSSTRSPTRAHIRLATPPESASYAPTSSRPLPRATQSSGLSPSHSGVHVARRPSIAHTQYGELLIDGLGVDGRDCAKGEIGWADPYPANLPTVARRPSCAHHNSAWSNLLVGKPSCPGTSACAATACRSGGQCACATSSKVVEDAGSDAERRRRGKMLGRSRKRLPSWAGKAVASRRKGAEPGLDSVAGRAMDVQLIDIVRGHSCRPISLLDLRTFLLAQRAGTDPSSSYTPASALASSALPDLSVLGGSSRKHEQSQSSDSHLTVDLTDNVNETEADHDKTLVDNVAGAKSKRKAASPPLVFDELDALEFVVVFDRYQRRFHSLSPGQKLKSPDPYTCIEALTARYDALRRARSTTVNTPMPDGALLQPPTTIEDDDPNLPTPFDVGLDPVKQPLRSRFNMMIQRYLGPIAGFPTEDLQKGNGLDRTISGRLSLPGLVGQKSDDKSPLPPNSSIPTVPRLSWMVDLGLLSEQAIGQALSEAEITTHPDVLAHIADLVSSHLSAHVLPAFLAASTRNLSGRTTHGRLTIAIVSLILAVLFSVLLLLDPSPLYVGSHGGSSRQPGTYNARPDAFAGNSSHPGWGHVSRWWRITTAPLWGAGIGYFIAARTGVCVWLTIRGNREPGEAEEREREQIRSRISSDAGFSFADLDSDAGMGQRGDGRKPWLAPELMGLVAKVTGNRDRSSGMGLSKSDSRTGDATEMTTVSNTPTTAPRSSTWPRLLTPPMPSVSAFDTLAHAFDARQRSSSVGGTPANAGAGVSSGQYGLGMRYAGGALEPLNEHQGAPSAAVSQAPSCVPTPAATAAAIPASSDAAPWAEPPARMSHPIVPPAINDTYFSPAAALLPTPSLRKKSLPGLPISLGIVKTPSTGLAPAPAAAAPHPAMRSARVQPPSKHRMRIHRLWLGIQQRTGFAVRTEHVQDERVRRAQQRIALSALLRCTAGTLLVLIVLVAIP